MIGKPEFVIEGAKEVDKFINEIAVRAASDEFWDGELEPLLEDTRRFAVSISPTVTGSYKASHAVIDSTLKIDPDARNKSTGELVTSYAGAVEARHAVYSKSFNYLSRKASDKVDVIGRRVVHGN